MFHANPGLMTPWGLAGELGAVIAHEFPLRSEVTFSFDAFVETVKEGEKHDISLLE